MELQKGETEIESLKLQKEQLEQVKQSKESQILKMSEEIKYQQAKLSKFEQNLFDH